MQGLCAPSTISVEEELEQLYAERNALQKKIEAAKARQNKATGIKESTMNAVYNALIQNRLDDFDKDDYAVFLEEEYFDMSYLEVIEYVSHLTYPKDHCIVKMLKEHAANILLKTNT